MNGHPTVINTTVIEENIKLLLPEVEREQLIE